MKFYKILAVDNGWSIAPHCWRRFLTHPIDIRDDRPWQYTIAILGIVFYLDTSKDLKQWYQEQTARRKEIRLVTSNGARVNE